MYDFKSIIEGIDDLSLHDKEGKIYKLLLDCLEKPLFERVLRYTGGNKLKAARALGLNRNTLRSKLKKLGMIQ
jgi:DNA-binding protein Fis